MPWLHALIGQAQSALAALQELAGLAVVVRALMVQQQPARLCGSCCAGGERRSTVAMVWEVLARMLAEPAQGAGLHARQAALLRGARRHLEAGHAVYMHATIQANRHLVRGHQ